MSKREGNPVVNTSLRIPKSLHKRLVAVQRTRPHMSMNSLIIEAVERELAGKARPA
jgi:predicted HicB family RNase H-like nuclease